MIYVLAVSGHISSDDRQWTKIKYGPKATWLYFETESGIDFSARFEGPWENDKICNFLSSKFLFSLSFLYIYIVRKFRDYFQGLSNLSFSLSRSWIQNLFLCFFIWVFQSRLYSIFSIVFSFSNNRSVLEWRNLLSSHSYRIHVTLFFYISDPNIHKPINIIITLKT